jgi:hypothetical protein
LGCNQPSSKKVSASDEILSPDSVVALIQQAYVYGYPMMMMDATKKASTNVPAPIPNKPIAPVNQFGHFRTFPDANFKEIVNLFCILCLSSSTSKAFTTYPLDENERLLVPLFWINLHVIPTIFRDFPI